MTLNLRKLTLSAAVIAAFAGAAHTAHAQATTLLFDNFTGKTYASTTSTPNTFMGDGYNLIAGSKDITGFDLFPVNGTTTNYTNLKLTVYVWGTVNTGTVSATTPAFSNLLNTYTLTVAGTYTAGFYYPFQGATPGVNPGITLATPLVIPSTQIGLTFAYQGSTDGVNYASVNNLTSLISYGAANTVGSNVFSGYDRNANSETNGNFTTGTRSLGNANESLAVRVYGDVTAAAAPEPSAVALSLSGAMLMVGGIVRRRRACA